MGQGTMLVNGEWFDTESVRDVRNPVDDTVIGTVACGGGAEATAAADAAADAFPGWAATPPRQRADILLRAADLLRERSTELGTLLAREAGKRLPEGIGEIAFSAEYLRWFAEEARRPAGTVHTHEAADRRHLSMRRPAGVVASLTPWNFPCSIQARKLAPALAAGCTVVARVSEKAPLAATELVRCLHDAGLPPGVLNLVHGPAAEITAGYLGHPAVRVVSFTGSTEVGRRILTAAAGRIVRPLLELGGNAPFVVFDDADIDAAVEGAMLAKFRNTGQSCIAANRFLVHAAVYQQFTKRLAAAMDAMSIGDGLAEPTPDLGPCIDHDRVREVEAIVQEAVAAGAHKLTRDTEVPGPNFARPALLADVPGHVRLATEEVFGPVAGVFPFHTEEEALAAANGTEMGLAAYVYTRDQARAWRWSEQLDNGIVGVNNPLPSVAFAPMGGTKQSGLGREGAAAGIEEFEETRYVAIGL
ncbi:MULTISPECIES: NAD-dependent succinate-semialdehyde dehydrogenase [Prauserella salsuginis group]|uniref:NAD-dependent succinate-semialdehyde dehydrogenase n=1 Tax=Prauserella salsuginis TaxID=387889 RepID=A0ABW6G1S9_9PSEU|nr:MULTISPECIES: NAD-dependent succinate-semialdehyde dehydrogenase [Prauserella salsuginis group]MCR3721649.1 succinate-semialdehyde dehydrogenase / glutarate-semialdehyde dehydrogenase [Prauserella flava]MCR3734341.1 succinate-semialdehyde dehydrogenase / glutarate-semialdehyde dehydrogenase [Prauserella salsuginis]